MATNITQRSNFKVIIGGSFVLAINAGFIGSIYIAGLHNAAITNVTGDIAKTGALIAQGRNLFVVARMTLVWICYIIGSSISAMIVSGTKQFELRRTFGWALLFESVLLYLSYYLIRSPEEDMIDQYGSWYWSEYCGAMACGLQNALCTSYSGAVIRTTHLTGVSTDIGIAIGQEIRLRLILPVRSRLSLWRQTRQRRRSWIVLVNNEELQPTDAAVTAISDPQQNSQSTLQQQQRHQPAPSETSLLWRLKVLMPLLFGYLIGVTGGSLAYVRFGKRTLLGPATFVLLLGVVYVIYTTRHRLSQTRERLQAATDIFLMPIISKTERAPTVTDAVSKTSSTSAADNQQVQVQPPSQSQAA
jgi:uncharacterized membrane protein YoaK (UPF0700 family)